MIRAFLRAYGRRCIWLMPPATLLVMAESTLNGYGPLSAGVLVGVLGGALALLVVMIIEWVVLARREARSSATSDAVGTLDKDSERRSWRRRANDGEK